MKARDADRASLLVDALADLKRVRRKLKRTKPAASGYFWRGAGMRVGDFDDHGGTIEAEAQVDVRTARKMLKPMLKIIKRELRSMGVEL